MLGVVSSESALFDSCSIRSGVIRILRIDVLLDGAFFFILFEFSY